jgi:hypothetical protein
MNRMATETDSRINVKVVRCGLLLAAAVIAYIAAVIIFIVVN